MKKRTNKREEEGGHEKEEIHDDKKTKTLVSGLSATEAIMRNPSRDPSLAAVLEKIRNSVVTALSTTNLPTEKKRVCAEEAIFIISRILQLRLRCDHFTNVRNKTGILQQFILPSLETNNPIEQFRKMMHYFFQIAAECLCAKPQFLTTLKKNTDITHIGYIVAAIQQAYPQLPELTRNDSINNCSILLNYLRTHKESALKFCSDIEHDDNDTVDN